MGEDGAEVDGRVDEVVGGPAGPESGPRAVSEAGVEVDGSGAGGGCRDDVLGCEEEFVVVVAGGSAAGFARMA